MTFWLSRDTLAPQQIQIKRMCRACHRPSASTSASSPAILHVPASRQSTWPASTLSSSFEAKYLTPSKKNLRSPKHWKAESKSTRGWLPSGCGRQPLGAPCPLAFKHSDRSFRNRRGKRRTGRPGIQRFFLGCRTSWQRECKTNETNIEILLGVPLQRVINSRHFLRLNLWVSQALLIYIACLTYLPNKPWIKGTYFLYSNHYGKQQALISSMVQNKMFSIREHRFKVCHTWALPLSLFFTRAQPFSTTKQGSLSNATPTGNSDMAHSSWALHPRWNCKETHSSGHSGPMAETAGQELTHLFWKRLKSNYLRRGRPYSLCLNYSTLLIRAQEYPWIIVNKDRAVS